MRNSSGDVVGTLHSNAQRITFRQVPAATMTSLKPQHLPHQLHAMEAQKIQKQFLLWETQEKSAQHWKEWAGGRVRITLVQEQQAKLSHTYSAILHPTLRATCQANPHERGSTGPCQGVTAPVTQEFFMPPLSQVTVRTCPFCGERWLWRYPELWEM